VGNSFLPEELHAKYPENPRFRTIVAQLKHRGLEHEMDLPFPFCTAVASESLLYSYCYCELRILVRFSVECGMIPDRIIPSTAEQRVHTMGQ
jgi:hypothetical protein